MVLSDLVVDGRDDVRPDGGLVDGRKGARRPSRRLLAILGVNRDHGASRGQRLKREKKC
jgi:hypothetical protein